MNRFVHIKRQPSEIKDAVDSNRIKSVDDLIATAEDSDCKVVRDDDFIVLDFGKEKDLYKIVDDGDIMYDHRDMEPSHTAKDVIEMSRNYKGWYTKKTGREPERVATPPIHNHDYSKDDEFNPQYFESFGWPMNLDDADPEDRAAYEDRLKAEYAAKHANDPDDELPFEDDPTWPNIQTGHNSHKSKENESLITEDFISDHNNDLWSALDDYYFENYDVEGIDHDLIRLQINHDKSIAELAINNFLNELLLLNDDTGKAISRQQAMQIADNVKAHFGI